MQRQVFALKRQWYSGTQCLTSAHDGQVVSQLEYSPSCTVSSWASSLVVRSSVSSCSSLCLHTLICCSLLTSARTCTSFINTTRPEHFSSIQIRSDLIRMHWYRYKPTVKQTRVPLRRAIILITFLEKKNNTWETTEHTRNKLEKHVFFYFCRIL